jgi:hypothetical protein
MAGVSIRQYSRDRKVSDTAVHKAIKAGKIVRGLIHENGKPKILPEIADKEWAEFKETVTSAKPLNVKQPANKNPKVEEAPGSSHLEDAPMPTGHLAKARLAAQISKAKLLELEYQTKKGVLVNRDQVYKALFLAGQEVRATFQAIPDRHIDEILSAKTRNESHEILASVINKALEGLAEILKREITPRQ